MGGEELGTKTLDTGSVSKLGSIMGRYLSRNTDCSVGGRGRKKARKKERPIRAD